MSNRLIILGRSGIGGSSAGMKRIIVETLPTEDIDENAIYMVPNGSSQEGNIYDEYMYINSAWEKIGSTKTDLSDYYTKEQTDGLLDDKANSSELKKVATSGSYNDLDNKPTIGDGTLKITQGGTEKGTFTANTSDDVSVELDAPSDAKITIKQGDEEKGSFTLNQDGDATIELSDGGSSSKQWFGTQNQFDALTEYDADTDYYITDPLYYSEIKNAPDPTKYYTKVEIDAKETTINSKIASKANIAVGMTQEEFDAATPLEGTDYLIEGETVELTFTLEDGTTVTHNFVIDD